MQKFKEKHILALIIWIGLLLIAIFTLPNISQLVRDKGAISLPSSVQSEVANTIQKKRKEVKAFERLSPFITTKMVKSLPNSPSKFKRQFKPFETIQVYIQ